MFEDLLLDRPGGNPSNIHKLGFDHLNKVKQMNDLVDIWWKKHPDKRLFTFHNNQQIHSRIESKKQPKNYKYIYYSKRIIRSWCCHSYYTKGKYFQ